MDIIFIRKLLEDDAPEMTKLGKTDKRKKSISKKLTKDPMHSLNRTTGKLTKVKAGTFIPSPSFTSGIPTRWGY